MSHFKPPWSANKFLSDQVPVAGELIYDKDKEVLVIGDGKTKGGRPLRLADPDGFNPVLAPSSVTSYAIALFSGTDGKRLQAASGTGEARQILVSRGANTSPEFRALALSDLPRSNTENQVLLSGGVNENPKYGLLPLASLETGGTSGQVLVSRGLGKAPVFDNIPAAWTIVHQPEEVKVREPKPTTLSITRGIDTTSDVYMIAGTNLSFTQDNKQAAISFFVDDRWYDGTKRPGVESNPPTPYFIALAGSGTSGPVQTTTTGKSLILFEIPTESSTKPIGNAGSDSFSFILYLFSPADPSRKTQFKFEFLGINEDSGTPKMTYTAGAGVFNQAAAVAGVRIAPQPVDQCTFATGSLALYKLTRG